MPEIVVLGDEACSECELVISAKVRCSKTAVHTPIVNFQNSGPFSDKR